MHWGIYAFTAISAVAMVSGAAFPGAASQQCSHTTCKHALEVHRLQPHNFCHNSPLRAKCNAHQSCHLCRAIAKDLNSNCNHEFCPHAPPPHTVTITKAPITVTKNPVTITKPAVTVTKAAVTVTKASVTTTKLSTTITKSPVTITQAPLTVTKPASTLIITEPPRTLTVSAAPITLMVTKTPAAVTVTEEPHTLTVLGTPTMLTVTETLAGKTVANCPASPTGLTASLTLTGSNPLISCPTTCSGQQSIPSSSVQTVALSSKTIASPVTSMKVPSQATPTETLVLVTSGNKVSTSTPVSVPPVSSSTGLSSVVSESTPTVVLPVSVPSLSLGATVSAVASVSTPTTLALITRPSILDTARTTSVAKPTSAKVAVSSSARAAAPTTMLSRSVATSVAAVTVINIPSKATYTSNFAAVTTTTVPATTTPTTSVCIPSPTQAITNPSFEDPDITGNYAYAWTFSGNGNVQSNANNAYQSYDGSRFAVLYGRSTTTTSMSQMLTDLVPNTTYQLQYHYNVEQASPQAICRLTVTSGGGVVDTLTSPTVRTGGYLSRTVPYTPTSASATLSFVLVCPRFVQLTAQSNYALDAITLTNSGEDGCDGTTPARRLVRRLARSEVLREE